MSRAKPPKYRLHKGSGQAVVTVDGKDYYLGVHGTERSRTRYAEIVRAWSEPGSLPTPAPCSDPTVEELIARFWLHAERYYRAVDGRAKSELASFKLALEVLRQAHRDTPASRFGIRGMRDVQGAMVARGWCRRVVNRMTTRVKTMFRWCMEEELVSPTVYHAVRSARGIPEGAAPDYDEVLPVPEEDLPKTLERLGRIPAALVRLQLLTGARPGELLGLRPCDLQRSERVRVRPGVVIDARGCWVFVPKRHKTSHRGHSRVILFGPEARKILEPFMSRAADAFLFSPREAAAEYLAVHEQTANFDRPRSPGLRYTTWSYGHAVANACRRAKVPRWTPHQLRHNAATRLVAQFGWETARIILGHSAVSMTAQYAIEDFTKAVDAVQRAG